MSSVGGAAEETCCVWIFGRRVPQSSLPGSCGRGAPLIYSATWEPNCLRPGPRLGGFARGGGPPENLWVRPMGTADCSSPSESLIGVYFLSGSGGRRRESFGRALLAWMLLPRSVISWSRYSFSVIRSFVTLEVLAFPRNFRCPTYQFVPTQSTRFLIAAALRCAICLALVCSRSSWHLHFGHFTHPTHFQSRFDGILLCSAPTLRGRLCTFLLGFDWGCCICWRGKVEIAAGLATGRSLRRGTRRGRSLISDSSGCRLRSVPERGGGIFVGELRVESVTALSMNFCAAVVSWLRHGSSCLFSSGGAAAAVSA